MMGLRSACLAGASPWPVLRCRGGAGGAPACERKDLPAPAALDAAQAALATIADEEREAETGPGPGVLFEGAVEAHVVVPRRLADGTLAWAGLLSYDLEAFADPGVLAKVVNELAQ